VLHDETLERTTDGHGLVRTRAWEEVRALDAGWGFTAPDGRHPYRGRGIRVPTLEEVLAAYPGVPLNVEVKQRSPAIVDRVLGVLDVHRARDRTLLAAEHHDVMETIRAAAPDVLTSFSALEVAEFVERLRDDRWEGYRPIGIALQVPPSFGDVTIVSSESVAVAHALGLEVHVWTINDPDEMTALLALGVDAIMTDLPAVGAPLLGRAHPPAGG
jgi:glycerophosphoryl diester phosphodiesterase